MMKKIQLIKVITLALLVLTLRVQSSSAEKVCITFKQSTKKLVKKTVSTGNCPRGYITVVDTSVLAGPAGTNGSNGTNGSAGADGRLAIWGDGSDGDITLSDSTAFDHTKQYRNITVAAGTTVDLYSGQTIKCSGTLTVSGTVYVQYPSSGPFIQPMDGSTYFPAHTPAKLGMAFSAAENGECATNPAIGYGGNGGVGFGGNNGRHPLSISRTDSGGSGGASASGGGGQPGGAVALYCKQGISITSTGIINATGGAGVNGGGGGGGGIIILASNGTISQAGTLIVSGGAGGNSTASSCAGAGGGGGFIHFIAPTVSSTGTNTTSGGAIGTNSVAISTSPRCGGGGGGGSYGGAGQGYTVTAGNTCSSAAVASDGGVRTTNPVGGSVEALLF